MPTERRIKNAIKHLRWTFSQKWPSIFINYFCINYFKLHLRYLAGLLITISLVLFLKFSFYFHFLSPISFTFNLQIPFHLVLHLLFYLFFVFLHLSSFLVSLMARNYFREKSGIKINNFIIFFPLDIYEEMFQFFLDYYFLRGYVLNFLVAVLICFLYFIVYRKMHIFFETLW